jgi:hypothetical protein
MFIGYRKLVRRLGKRDWSNGESCMEKKKNKLEINW